MIESSEAVFPFYNDYNFWFGCCFYHKKNFARLFLTQLGKNMDGLLFLLMLSSSDELPTKKDISW